MSNVTESNAIKLLHEIKSWNKNLWVHLSPEGDTVIAYAKSIDVSSDDLRSLAEIVDKYDDTITMGRSGANFRMIIW
jgi:hypothetical protein